ncbi:MAG: efflux RND transporter periplasmic adaptor subunit [Gammaproteobacteria bacterium]|nr:efflux RND transporter periplasmic adaptor subunit [Gammaproteobacteria bacterium]
MKLLKIALPILLLIVAAFASKLLINSGQKIEAKTKESYTPVVRVLSAQNQNYQLYLHSQGSVRPQQESELIAEVTGKVRSLAPQFAVGGFFKQGELLLSLEQSDYDLQVQRAEAVVTQAKQRYLLSKTNSEQALFDWQQLGKKGQASPLLLKKPQLIEAKAKLSASKVDLALARLNLERTEIHAPYDGYLKTKQADLGLYLRAGSSIGRFYSLDKVEIRLPLHQQQLAFLEQNPHQALSKPIAVELKQQQQRWQGLIQRSEQIIDSQTRMHYLVAEVDNSHSDAQPQLTPGQFVQARIEGKQLKNVFVLPRNALRGQDQLWIIDAHQRLHLRSVDVARLENNVVIISKGLKNGEQVCLSKLEVVVENMRVTIANKQP